MIQEILALYDSKARAFNTPIFTPRIEVGLRAIRGAVNAPGTFLHTHPEDYTVFYLGQYDDEKGEFLPLAQARNLGLCTQFKEALPAPQTKNIQLEVKADA